MQLKNLFRNINKPRKLPFIDDKAVIKMTLHHHIQGSDLEAICPYCFIKLDEKEWNSEFDIEEHYKCHICKCGKKVCLKVNFHGSGHDEWRKETNLAKINGLERK